MVIILYIYQQVMQGLLSQIQLKLWLKKYFDIVAVDVDVDVIDHKLKTKYLNNLKIKKIINPIDLFTFIKNNNKKIELIIHMAATSLSAKKVKNTI